MKNNTTILKNILLIIIVSSLLGLTFNMFSDTGISLRRKETTYVYATEDNLAELTEEGQDAFRPKIISIEQAFTLYNYNSIFIDARDKWDFAEGHVAGAINIPQYKYDPDSDVVKSLSKENTYVIYCNDDDCETSERLAAELSKIGFTKIFIFASGWNSWTQMNYPSEISDVE